MGAIATSPSSSAWFFFSVRGAAAGEELRFELRGYSNQLTLFNKYDHRPVVRAIPLRPSFERLRSPAAVLPPDADAFHTLTFRHTVEAAEQTVFFAFTYPYPLERVRNVLGALERARPDNGATLVVHGQHQLRGLVVGVAENLAEYHYDH